MKLEVAESLIYSWLRHEKNCTIVQMNWKPSTCWKKMNESWLEDLYKQWIVDEELKEYFKLNKSNESSEDNIHYDQFIAQTEIDVLGIDKEGNVYAVDTAFHEHGLRYKDNVKTVIKKIIRMAFCLKAYFDTEDKKNKKDKNSNFFIYFATPKILEGDINKLVFDKIQDRIQDKFRYNVEFYYNDKFYNKIMFPTIDKSRNNSDTSELFMRSWILYDMRSNEIKKQENAIITFIDHVDEKTRSKTITLKNLEEKFKVNNKKIFSKTKQENFKQIKDRRLYLSIDIIKEKKVDDLEKIKKDFDNFIKDKAKNHVNVFL